MDSDIVRGLALRVIVNVGLGVIAMLVVLVGENNAIIGI